MNFGALASNPFYPEIALRLCAALTMGGLVGLERSYHGRTAGFRMHALVCMSNELLMLVSVYGTRGFWGAGKSPARPMRAFKFRPKRVTVKEFRVSPKGDRWVSAGR